MQMTVDELVEIVQKIQKKEHGKNASAENCDQQKEDELNKRSLEIELLKQENKILKDKIGFFDDIASWAIEIVQYSGMKLEQIAEKFQAGYELVPPSKPEKKREPKYFVQFMFETHKNPDVQCGVWLDYCDEIRNWHDATTKYDDMINYHVHRSYDAKHRVIRIDSVGVTVMKKDF